MPAALAIEFTQVSIMQEYRINYTLLIGLIVGTLVCSGAIWGLHRFQNSRQSGWLISEAERAIAEKNYHDAVQYYEQYITIHPDDVDTKLKYANTYLDLVEQDDVSPEDISSAIQVLETMLRNSTVAVAPEAKAVRRRLIDFYGKESMHNYAGALDHIKLLIESDPNNVDLQVLRATLLVKSGNIDDAVKHSYKLIGYDPDPKKDEKKAFDVKKAIAPHATEVYFNLAGTLRAKANNPTLAGKVANQMVAVNPNDAAAHVYRGRLLAAWGDNEGSKADAQKAYQLKPEDTDVLLLVTDIAAHDKNYDKARGYLAAAKKLHPKEARIYLVAAGLEIQQGKVDKALAELDAGAKAVGGNTAINLQFAKTRLQIESNDLKGARQTIEDMQQSRKLAPEVNDFFDALLLVAENKWYPGVEALSKLRPRMAGFPKEMTTQVDIDLALCYERLGRNEQAKQFYDLIVQQDPKNAFAVAGSQRTGGYLGLKSAKSGPDPIQAMIAEELQKPKEKQDWSRIDKAIDELAIKIKLDPNAVQLFKAQIAMMREDYDGAAKIVLEAEKAAPENLPLKRFKIQLARLNPKIGPEKALAYWQKVVDQFGDQAALRLDKADILMSLSKDKQDKQQLKQDLASLATGIDSWKTQQKVELWGGIARNYLNLNMMDEARQYLNLVADNQPQELPVRLDLFAMALQADDADGMKSAQDKILQVVGDQNDSAWLYAEARRKLWLMRRNQLGREALPEIRSLVKRALDQRDQWGDLYALRAEIELVSNNAALALKDYDRAEELGRPKPTSVAAHIKLLSLYGRYPDAGKLLDRIPEPLRQPLLGQLYAEILFRTNQVDAAVKQAKAATEADPTNAQSQYWYSQLLTRSAQDLPEARRNETMNLATQAMQKATELSPEFPDAWFALINFFLMQNKVNEAQKAMRDAQLVLSGDNLATFLAHSYESLHRWFDAETMYREIYEVNPTDLQRAQQLAAFYLGPIYPRPDQNEKATPLINQILKAGADGKLTPGDTNLLWARRMAAKLLAGTRDYQNSKKAENLLASNSQDGSLLVEDKIVMAGILASRPEPISRKKAIALFEEIDQVQRLSESAAIQLAELYYTTGSEWSKYQTEMDKVIKRFPNSAQAHESYIRRLLTRGDSSSIERATALASNLQKIAPNYPGTFGIAVRIAAKSGKQKQNQIAEALRRRIPNLEEPKELDASTKQTAAMLANLLTDLKDYEAAEKIYRSLAARDPKLNYELAKFIGMQRSPDECFAKLSEIFSPEKIPETLDVAMTVIRERRDKVGDKFDAQVQRWIDAGLRENPDSISLLSVQADLFDLQKRYDDAASLYRKLLDRKDLVGFRRAVVINNLAYLLALADKSTATDIDLLKLVSEAADILGPNSDILDTRAVVFMSRGQYKEAIADLELAVTDNPTASKYFHLAQAHLGAKESRAAVEAWEKAEGLGLSRESINRMEFDRYDKAKAEIDKIRGPSVTKSDLRKAG